DGRPRPEVKAVTTAIRIPLDLDPGGHVIRIEGLGEGVAFLNTPPAAGEIIRRRVVEELVPGGTLTYHFPVEMKERQELLLQVLTETPERAWKVSYQGTSSVQGGEQRFEGARYGVSQRATRVEFWDTRERKQVGWSATRIRLPLAKIA